MIVLLLFLLIVLSVLVFYLFRIAYKYKRLAKRYFDSIPKF